MDRTRRTFLTTAGAATLGGCLGAPNLLPSSNRTESPDPTGTATDEPTTTADGATDTPKPTETTIGFAGDTMVGRTLNEIYGQDDADPASIWGDFQSRLQSLDGVCCNLECCLSTRGERHPHRAYYFRGDPEWAVPALTAGNIQFTALANNHAMDYGEVSLLDTIDILDEAGIEAAGTGATATHAWAPTTFTIGDLDIAAISFSDQANVYAATEDNPGIAWTRTDPENANTQRVVGQAIERAQQSDPDLLIASVHWGENWIERPNNRLISFSHWLVDQGVDLVHGHSAHVVQGIEQYGNGIILHDTGNLVDDFGVKSQNLGNDKSYLFEVTLTDGEFEEIRLRPFYIDDGVHLPSNHDARWLRRTMRDRTDLFDTTYERAGNGLRVVL